MCVNLQYKKGKSNITCARFTFIKTKTNKK